MQSKKVLIMPSRSSPEGAPEGEGQSPAPGPFSPSDLRILNTGADIWRVLGRIEHSVGALETTTKSHTEKIEQLTQWVSAIPHLEKDVAQNTKDLNELGARQNKDLNELGRRLEKDVNELGRRHDKEINDLKNIAHTASTFGKVAFGLIAPVFAAIILAVLAYIYHAFEKLLLLQR